MVDKLEIYSYCKGLWEKLIERDGEYKPSNHDNEVLNSASKKFKITVDEVDAIYQEIAMTEAKKEAQGMSQSEIRDELIKIIKNNKDNNFT